MNRATGRESTPTRRSWTSVSRPQTSTSGTARARSPMKCPKRPTILMAATVLRPIRSITGLKYSSKPQDAKPQAVDSEKWPVEDHRPLLDCEPPTALPPADPPGDDPPQL